MQKYFTVHINKTFAVSEKCYINNANLFFKLFEDSSSCTLPSVVKVICVSASSVKKPGAP